MSSSAGAASSTARGSGRRSSSSSSTTSSSSLPTYSSSGNNGYTSLRNGSDAIVNLNDNRKKGENFNLPEDASMPLTNRCETPSSTTSTAVPATKASWLRIYSLCIANFGINCAWALEFAMTTPYFEKGLKAGKVISHAVWLVGPLSGFIVAPIVGSLSDRCRSRFGRRRPFIFAGMIATLVGMALFSNALGVAQFLVGSVFRSGEERIVQIVSITVAILAFCVLDLAINTTMWPVRALQGDLIPVDQQHSVQSASIVMFSLGDLTASALLRLFPEPVSQIQICFLVAALIYSTSVASLLLLGHETPLTPLTDEEHHDEEADASGEGDTSETAQRRGASAYNIFAYLHALPSWMWRIGITHALGFFALFCFLPNTSSWLGGSVLGGSFRSFLIFAFAYFFKKNLSCMALVEDQKILTLFLSVYLFVFFCFSASTFHCLF